MLIIVENARAGRIAQPSLKIQQPKSTAIDLENSVRLAYQQE
jgi:hypothetical protein